MRGLCLIYIQWPQTNSTSPLLRKKEWTTLMVRFHKQKYVCVCVSLLWASSTSPVGWRLTELEGLRLSWESVSGGNWKSAGRVVFLLLALRADLLLVVAACEGKNRQHQVMVKVANLQEVTSPFSWRFYLQILFPILLNLMTGAKPVFVSVLWI